MLPIVSKMFHQESHNCIYHMFNLTAMFKITCILYTTILFIKIISEIATKNLDAAMLNTYRRYHHLIENLVYSDTVNYVTNIGNEHYPFIQHSTYGKYCLICRKVVVENAEDHIFLQKHDKSLKKEVFDKIKEFHTEWLNLPLKYQLQQVFIKMKASDKYVCSLCETKRFLPKNLKQHLDSHRHQQELNKMTSYFGQDRNQLENLLDNADCKYIKSNNSKYFLLLITISNVSFSFLKHLKCISI